MFVLQKQRWAALAIFVITTGAATSADITWTGTASDETWNTPGNWSGGAVPTAADNVLIGAAPGNLIGLVGGDVQQINAMTFLAAAPAFTITDDGAGNVLQFNSAGVALANDSANRQIFDQVLVRPGVSQTWDGKANGFVFTTASLGSGNVVTLTGSGTTAATRNEITGAVSGLAGSSAGLTKAGSGVLFVGAGASLTYDGPTTLTEGTLLLGGSNVLSNTSSLVLSGGTFDIAGFDETAGKLTLSGNATINFGVSNTADLVFDASQLENWGAFTLNIVNFDPGQDTLRFGTSAAGLDVSQLAKITFNGESGAQIDGNGFVSVPEPSAALLLGIGAVAIGSFRRRQAAKV